jgi:SAM-dependent methyltransferase
MSTDQDVTAHYRHGSLEEALLTAVAAMGKDPMHLSPADLMGADEFHIGGAQATRDLAAQLGLTAAMHLLDLGSGLGGPARHLAATHGCRITGIDLSTEYVAVATSLTRRMGLSNQVNFHEGSAIALPFEETTFDGATLLHVGMNIADKRALCASVHRVLRPGGFFAIYDVMRTGPGDLNFPVPWSSAPETSFVEPPETYRAALTGAGFTIQAERSRAMFARDFFAALRSERARHNRGRRRLACRSLWARPRLKRLPT